MILIKDISEEKISNANQIKMGVPVCILSVCVIVGHSLHSQSSHVQSQNTAWEKSRWYAGGWSHVWI